MRKFLRDVRPGDRIQYVSNTVYEVTHVSNLSSMTTITYTVEGSHMREKTVFTRPSLTTTIVL